MPITKQTTNMYSAVIETGERTTVRICSADGGAVFSFHLPSQEDVCRFVQFLNDNRIEAVHVKDCFHDYLVSFYEQP